MTPTKILRKFENNENDKIIYCVRQALTYLFLHIAIIESIFVKISLTKPQKKKIMIEYQNNRQFKKWFSN